MINCSSFPPFVCPYDHNPLTLSKESQLYHCGNCNKIFPVINGIPDFLAHGMDVKSEEHLKERDEWIKDDKIDYGDPFRNAIEVPGILERLDAQDGDIVLDAACGKGRLAIPLLQQKDVRVVGVDFSGPALVGFARRAPDPTRVRLAKADLAWLPFPPQSFDCAMAVELLSHLPTNEVVNAVLTGLRDSLKPGGKLIITAINYSWGNRAVLKYEKIGCFPDTQIFVHFYDKDELLTLLKKYFIVNHIDCLFSRVPKLTGLFSHLGSMGVGLNTRFDQVFRHFSAAEKYGWLLVADCTVP